jgi:putative acetyltransferase
MSSPFERMGCFIFRKHRYMVTIVTTLIKTLLHATRSMNHQITITPFQPAHQQGVDSLLAGVQDEYPETIYGSGTQKLVEVYMLPGRKYWVTLDSHKVIGSIGLVFLSNNYACLKSMFLQKEYRGGDRHIADQLLAVALKTASDFGIKQMILGTMIQFKAAQAFYFKNGFTILTEDRLPTDFIKNPVDKVFFQLNLI